MKVYIAHDDNSCKLLLPEGPEFDTLLLHHFHDNIITEFPVKRLEVYEEYEKSDNVADAFLLYGLSHLIISETAARALNTTIDSSLCFGPIQTPFGIYLAYKSPIVTGAIDHSKSKLDMTYIPKRKVYAIREVIEYAMNVEALSGHSVFEMQEFPMTKLFVSEAFVDAFRKHQLQGLRFEQVFPDTKQEQREALMKKYADKRRKAKRSNTNPPHP